MTQTSVDFLKAHRHGKHGRPGRFWRAALWSAAVLFVLILPVLYSGIRLAIAAEAGRAGLEAAQAAAERLDFKASSAAAAQAHDDFLDARERADALKYLAILPLFAPTHAAMDAVLASGIAGADAMVALSGIADDVLGVIERAHGPVATGPDLMDPATLFKDLTADDKRAILAAIAADSERLKSAADSLAAAQSALDSVPTQGVPERFLAAIAPLRDRLAGAKAALGAAAPFADVLPSLLGYPAAKHYLFFFENNDELRPGGGFLGVYGAVTVQDAGVTDLKTDDVYALDGPSEKTVRPAAPAPIQKYIGVKQWYLRDANWSPDFPTSARLMAQFYGEEAAVVAGGTAPAPIDGIIAITPDFAEDVVRLIGPVTAAGVNFDAENLIETLEYEVEQGFASKGVAYDQRKDIVGALVHAVTEKLLALPVARLFDAAGIVERNLAEGHIMLYSTDTRIQAAIEAHDWGGKMKPVTGDYVSWIDANLAALKSDSVMERSLEYTIEPEDGGTSYLGRVAMTYHNTGSFTWKTTRYRTYARVYLPGATEFLGVDGAMENDKLKDPARRTGAADGYDQLGRRAFGAFIAVEPGETRTLTFRFRLAPQVAELLKSGRYHLDVEKQLGTGAVPLTLDLDVGKKLTSATPSENRKDFGDTHYRLKTDLRLDRAFDLQF